MHRLFAALLALALAGIPVAAAAAEPRCGANDPLRRPFFGDTHVHTGYSQDASTQGNRATPRDAYRFARGEPLAIQPWDAEGNSLRTIQLSRPLDFTVVTDHAEQIGEVHICKTPGLEGHDSLVCKLYRSWPNVAFFVMNGVYSFRPERWGFCGEDGEHCLAAARNIWQDTQDAAEEAYDRSPECRFTSFVGYEWTSMANSGHLHRNVVFRNETVPELPISHMETGPSGLELWRRLESECREGKPGCEAITIPHNSNLSRGSAFTSAVTPGEPITAEEVLLRARYERLAEVMQHKGDSECFLSADVTDEACGFEKTTRGGPEGVSSLLGFGADDEADQGINMVREALKRGLALDARYGANPFRFGLIASTDTHLAAPGLTEERTFQGHGGAGASHASSLPPGLIDSIGYNPGGLAVLWAEENSREALFGAMLRREAYGTSGTRPMLRFFGGWEFASDLCNARDLVAQGYAQGVPMGGSLPAQPAAAQAPVFVMSALRDPAETASPLERIEVVKGWLEDGELREQVVTVAGGDAATSVDLETCAQSGPATSSLCSVWRDPDFDADERAFYYARLRENPSCRWSQWACVDAGVRCSDPATIGEGFEPCCAPEHRPVVQERAWSSPIWFEPPGA
ncbi:MAG: DUF3604 domain-containing protein [Deltaproteobacteria bacterium]|nr:DUF3604 domain-containing protein [Deltaproteobacteria bacterium]MBW2362412.1 DUF3604 domain-containing protein [Deltaproteobacteria bacterium]